MTENQKLKMEILKEFAISDEPQSIETCRRAYAFLMEGETQPQPTAQTGKHLKDGVYYVTTDNMAIPYSAVLTPPEDIKGIGVVMGERRVVVALVESPAGEETTLTTKKDPSNLPGNYINEWDAAVTDFDGQKNTEHLKAVGLNSNIHLEDGQYIPSLGEMYIIYLNRKAINEALAKIDGAQPIADDWYWTSTEYSAPYAWRLYLFNGAMSGDTKATNTYRVRPVSAFIS